MKTVISFILGLFTGGILGVTLMCCLQLSSKEERRYEKLKYKDEFLKKK